MKQILFVIIVCGDYINLFLDFDKLLDKQRGIGFPVEIRIDSLLHSCFCARVRLLMHTIADVHTPIHYV